MISDTLFKAIADRLAKQEEYLETGYTSAGAEGGGYLYPRIHDGTPVGGDYSLENGLIANANSLDSGLTLNTALTTNFSTFVNSLKTYLSGEGYASYDLYLSGVGINVADEFDYIYNAMFATRLDAINVFGPVVDPMATFLLSGAGAGTFSGVAAVGSGTGKADTDNHAAADLEVVVVSATVTAGTLTCTCKKEDLTTEDKDVIFAGTETVGDVKPIGTPGTDMYLEVTNITVAGGAATDEYKVRSILERVIAL